MFGINGPSTDDTSKIENFRIIGNKRFKEGNYQEAIENYSLGICAFKSGDIDSVLIPLFANRSAAYMRLGMYEFSLSDAQTVLDVSPNHVKAIYRKSKSLFGLARYEEAVGFLEVKLKDSNEKSEMLKLLETAKIYVKQQKYGEYDFDLLMKSKSYPLDLADFTSPTIEIAKCSNVRRGRGVFATEDISAGQLIIASKAFDIVFPSRHTTAQKYNPNPTGDKLLINSIRNLLTTQPGKREIFYKLYAGPDLGFLNENNPDCAKIDIDRITGICNFNGFAHGDRIHQSDLDFYENWGVWILPSYINHSCVDCNCIWRICGDFMFVRAFKPIAKGEEILISYLSPEESKEKRRRIIDKHKFQCECRLCVSEKLESETIGKRRESLLKEIEIQVSIKSMNDNKRLENIIIELDTLGGGKPELNFYLQIALRKLAEWYYGHFQYLESAKSLERAHSILQDTVLCRSAVHVAVNVISSHIQCKNYEKVMEWLKILQEDVKIAYGTPVNEIICAVAPHTVQELRKCGITF